MKIEDVLGTGKAGAEVARQVGEIIKEPTSNLINPSAKTIGQRVSDIFDLIFTPFEMAKIYKDHGVERFKQSLNAKIDAIPEDKRVSPPLNVVGPALEASKYYIENEKLREMFADLIASAMTSDKTELAHPSFVEIIKQLSPLDGKLISMFNFHNTYPTCNIRGIKANGDIIPYRPVLFDFRGESCASSFEEEVQLTVSLDNLIRLGIVFKRMGMVPDFNYDFFKTCRTYLALEQLAIENSPDNTLEIVKSRIELTAFGYQFLSCCLPKKQMNL